MHKIFPRAASFLDAAAAARPLLPSSHMPALRLAGPFLATRANPITTRLRPRPWPRCGGGGAVARRGLCCSAEAAGRGDDAKEADGRVSAAGGGAGGRTSPERRQRGRGDAAMGSGELLAIPGVGPRNQRKLVEKGFDGVAQLKQLYRDKVCCAELFWIVRIFLFSFYRTLEKYVVRNTLCLEPSLVPMNCIGTVITFCKWLVLPKKLSRYHY